MLETAEKYVAYVGTYTTGDSKGIYVFNMDPFTGKWELLDTVSAVENPSYLAISKDRRHLYSVGETNEFNGRESGAAASFSIDERTGRLKFINMQASGGRAPCHIAADAGNMWLFVANYAEGTVSIFSIESDGSISKESNVIYHKGSGPVLDRQEKAHAHFVGLTPDEKFLCAVDLGIDRIVVYDFNGIDGKLKSLDEKSVPVRPGAGPRHMDFHPGGRFAYLLNELTSDIVVLEYAGSAFRQVQFISALPQGYSGESYAAAIHVSRDGKFLYASNRGHDSIASYKIDGNNGRLELLAHTSTGGNFPRDFAIDPAGRYLYAANQHTGNIVQFKIPDSGVPIPTGYEIKVPDAVCIKLI